MANNPPLNPEELELSKRLRMIWDRKKKALSLSQEKAAEMYGCTQGNISQYLGGKIPLNTDAIYKFASILEVSPKEIDPAMDSRLSLEVALNLGGLTAKDLLPILEKLSPVEAAKFLGMAEAIVDKKLQERDEPKDS